MMYHENRGKDEDQQANYQLGTSSRVITSSPSSSPSHEFSFTLSLNPSSSYYTKEISEPNRTKSFTSSFIDLSPADDIFFHGQLLPLHHDLSHFPSSVSPRSSMTSQENFTLPTHDVFSFGEKKNQIKQNAFEHQRCPTLISSTADQFQETRPKANTVQKPFPFFGLQKWRKGCEEMKQNETEVERQQQTKRKLKLDNVSHTLKRYIRMVRRPFLSFRNNSRREAKVDEFERQSYSYSFSGMMKKEKRVGMEMGYSSAPASIWTSPTNSGHLVATPETIRSSSSDSTMEELQAAIQAAIAHCKNSIANEDHHKNP